MNIFDFAINMEKEGEAFYRQLADQSPNPGLKKILIMLADDEVKHAETFEIMKKDTPAEMAETRILKYAKNVFEQMRESGAEIKTDISQIELYKKAQKSNRPFDAVILDLTVPGGMSGKESVNKLIEIDPRVTAIVSSGYSNDPIMADYEKYGFRRVGVRRRYYSDDQEDAVIMTTESILTPSYQALFRRLKEEHRARCGSYDLKID